jgi:hypothetical protein
VVPKARRAVDGRAAESVLFSLAPPYAKGISLRWIDEGNTLPFGTAVLGLGNNTLEVLATLANGSGRTARSVKDLAIWCCDHFRAWSH